MRPDVSNSTMQTRATEKRIPRVTTALMHQILRLAPLLALISVHAIAADFKDNFDSPKLEQRRAVRGDWKIADGIARCTQDDELYKKNKDHGPIIFYDVPTQDSTVHFAFKPQGCKTLVFTLNGGTSHVFRFITSDKGTSIRAFPANSAEHASKPLAQDGPKLAQGEWAEVTVEIRGPKAAVKIGKDYAKTVEDPAIAQAKTNLSIGFSFGTLEVKDFAVKP